LFAPTDLEWCNPINAFGGETMRSDSVRTQDGPIDPDNPAAAIRAALEVEGCPLSPAVRALIERLTGSATREPLRLISLKEAAYLLNVSRSTLWGLRKRRELPPTRLHAGREVFQSDELNQYIRTRRIATGGRSAK
jgi:predicted DNA-binding transcriptional regulator AlpA